MFVDPVLGEEVYNADYYRGKGADPLVNYEAEYQNYAQTDRVLEFRDLLRLASRELASRSSSDEPVRWMDFGCGAGGFLKFLHDQKTLPVGRQQRLIEPSGFDVGEWADRLKNERNFHVINLEQLQSLPDHSFDVITMVEVIEHIPSGHEPLALVARLLKPGGLLLLTTGNLSSPVAKRKGINYSYCRSEIHVSLYNPRCLAYTYRKVGLVPLKVRYREAIAFKVLKNAPRSLPKSLAKFLVKFPPLLWLADYLYGISEMPCAVKPPK